MTAASCMIQNAGHTAIGGMIFSLSLLNLML